MKSRAIARMRGFLIIVFAAACGGEGTGPNAAPVASVGGPYTTVTGTISFDGSASSDPDGDAITYRWDFGDGQSSTESKPVHTYAAVGNYSVKLVVTDAKGAASPAATTTVAIPNTPPAVSAPSNASVPLGSPYSLSATFKDSVSEGAPWSYSIDWGDGARATGSKNSATPITASHTYASDADYRIKITVTDRRGAAGSDSLVLTVSAPVLLAAGDIADCDRPGDEQTANLLDGLEGIVVPLGDNAYESGTPEEYATCYDPTWGRHKSRTRPVAGNHDYYNPGPAKNADGYFAYFGAAAGDPTKGYYSYTLGSWFVIVVNTGPESPSYFSAGSTQEQWLRAELASHSQQCVLVMFHHPHFSIIRDRPYIRPETRPIWEAMYEYGVDLVLNGHDHAYERFAPMKPDGTLDPAFGIRQITIGTGGGENLYLFGADGPNVDAKDNTTLGVIKVTLRSGGYDWQFIPVAGKTYTDSGSANCHGRPM